MESWNISGGGLGMHGFESGRDRGFGKDRGEMRTGLKANMPHARRNVRKHGKFGNSPEYN